MGKGRLGDWIGCELESWIAMSEARLEAGAPLTVDVDVDIGIGDGIGLETGVDPEVGTRFNRFLSFGARFATRMFTFSASLLTK